VAEIHRQKGRGLGGRNFCLSATALNPEIQKFSFGWLALIFRPDALGHRSVAYRFDVRLPRPPVRAQKRSPQTLTVIQCFVNIILVNESIS